MEKIKRILKITGGVILTSSSVIISSVFPPFLIPGIPLMIGGLGISYDGFMKQDLKKSVFKVNNDNKLVENPFKIGKSISLMTKKDKVRNFLNESINAFKQLKVEENNNKITYKMETHGFVKKRLEELQQLGYLENVESKVQDNGKEKSFFLENLGMGNFKNLFKKKKKYDITFNLTGKSFDNNYIELSNYMDSVVNRKKEQQKINKREEVKKEEKSERIIQIEELQRRRQEIIDNSINNEIRQEEYRNVR